MIRLFFATVLVSISFSVYAEVPPAVHSALSPQSGFQLSFQSEHIQPTTTASNESGITPASELTATEPTSLYFIGNLKRYDATWLYPVSQSAGMNVNLGVNLRYFDGQISTGSTDGRVLQNFRSTIPMFYARALFDLPFKGLTARVDGGSQIDVEWDNLFTSFDYKAALRYDWRNGIGLEGGWQHRQWQLDDLNSTDSRIESKGLFLDLKYQF